MYATAALPSVQAVKKACTWACRHPSMDHITLPFAGNASICLTRFSPATWIRTLYGDLCQQVVNATADDKDLMRKNDME